MSGNDQCWVVVNKESGSVGEIYDDAFQNELEKRLKANGWKPTFHVIKGAEIDGILNDALEAKIGTIISAGGDGTVNGIATKLVRKEITLGILPFGTLNLVARDLEMPLDPLEAASHLYPGKTRKIGTLQVNGKTCLCVTFFGFYPVLLHKENEVHSNKWWMKFVRMGKEAYRAFNKSSSLHIELESEEGKKTVSTRLLALVPGDFDDAFGFLPKKKELESGYFHLYSSNHKSRWSMVRLAVGMLWRSPGKDPDFSVVTAHKCRISIKKKKSILSAIDGETLKLELPVEAVMQPPNLTLLDPRELHS